MYHQTAHGQPSPWVPDFNSVGVAPSSTAEVLSTLDGLDRLTGVAPPETIDWSRIEALGITHVAVHHLRLGRQRNEIAVSSLINQGWSTAYEATEVSVFIKH